MPSSSETPTINNPTRELAAIMFSNIAGYTAIMGRDESDTVRRSSTTKSPNFTVNHAIFSGAACVSKGAIFRSQADVIASAIWWGSLGLRQDVTDLDEMLVLQRR